MTNEFEDIINMFSHDESKGYGLNERLALLAAPFTTPDFDTEMHRAMLTAELITTRDQFEVLQKEPLVNLDYDPLFHQSFDAMKWAVAFEEIVVKDNVPIDKGLMVGWFANAIMRGWNLAMEEGCIKASDEGEDDE